MNRRSFLATAGAVAVTGVAGCPSFLDDDGPSFEITKVQVYEHDNGKVFVAPTVRKMGSEAGRLRLEARLQFSNTYDHGHEQAFGVRGKVDEYIYVLPFTLGSSFLAGKTYEARARIAGQPWVDETERVASVPATGDDQNETS